MQALRRIEFSLDDMTYGRLLARQAARNGLKTYLLFEGRSYSYNNLKDISASLASGLVRFGVTKGEHVALFVGNCAETLFLNFALGEVGAVACPINTAVKGDLLAYFLNYSDTSTLIIGKGLMERFVEIEADAPGVRRLIVVDEAGELERSPEVVVPPGKIICDYDQLLSGERVPLSQVSASDPQCISFTSGTTGPSKGVVITNAQCFAQAKARVEYFGLRADDVVYTSLPLFHGNALRTAAIAAFVADATLLLARRFSASGFWREVRDNGVTQFNLLGSMTNILWGQEPTPLDRAHKVRQCTMVPVPPFAREFTERFGIEIVSSYSLTDFGQGTILQPGSPPEKFRSAGLPRPGVALGIFDDNDQALPSGEVGEVCLKSSDPTIGGRTYYKLSGEAEKSYRGGWFHTGDRGYLDQDGYLYFVDRKKDAIRRRGENISAWEVEQVIARHPSVAEVAVFPVSSDMSEDEVMASIVCKSGQKLGFDELIKFCERNMSYFMVPRFVEFVEDLPRTETAKVLKRSLRVSAEQRIADIWDREASGIALTR